MSYKYDPENGYRNADQIGADNEEFNPELFNIVQAIKKTKDTRMAINMLSAYIRGMNDYIEEKESKNEEIDLVSNIQKDIKTSEENRKNIIMTSNETEIQNDDDKYKEIREKNIEVTTKDEGREIGA